MVKLTIDGMPVNVQEGTTILTAAASVGIPVPHLCYLKGINEIGACRVCVVEVEGETGLVAACEAKAAEGMVVYTNSPKVREARKTNVELILSNHDFSCAACVRCGNCSLQTIATDLGIIDEHYERVPDKNEWNKSFPLIKDASKCIKCMRCIQICDKVQSLGVWDVEGTGSRTKVNVSFGRKIEDADCSLCGQCITHCPVGALRERDDTDKVFDALADKDIVTVVQVAPAVRAAWGESFGMKREEATPERMVAALKKIGFNYVFDTDLSADLTIMEEGSELLEQLSHADKHKFPMFTSCCPGWVRFMKSQYPDMVGQLSTSKSPHEMFGAVIKTYFAQKINVDPSKIFVVSIMPCTAKKAEAAIPNLNDAGAGQDVDVVLTVREMDRMIKAEHILPQLLKGVAFDQPLEKATGAGVIFGATGGVLEAALRSAYFLVTKKNPDADAFKAVRSSGLPGVREAEFEIAGTKLRVAAVSGLGNTRELIEKIRSGEVKYDFVEVMACPGGCAGGGGQPIHDGYELAYDRSSNLYALDKNAALRFSHENPDVQKLYTEFFGSPLSEKAEKLLHTDHFGWEMPLAVAPCCRK